MNRICKLAAGALAALALGPPAAAQADSILYVRGSDLWLTTPDGARQHQVTRTGTYHYASQSDDGTIIALTDGGRLHRIDRVSGAVTADFTTPVSATPPNSSFIFEGPYTPAISPDGTKVAYGYSTRYIRYDPHCGYPGGCVEGRRMVGTGYSHADRTTPLDEPGMKYHSGWQWPSWLDDSHVVISQPWEPGNLAVWVDTLGDDTYGRPWFGITANGSVYETEVNRQQTAVVSIASTGKFLEILRMHSPWPDGGLEACLFTGNREGPTFRSPSWSPDGTRIAWDDGASVQIMSNIDMTGCNWDAPTSAKLVDGVYPDWGPADVPAVGVTPPRAEPPRAAPRARRDPAVCSACGKPGARATVRATVGRATFAKGIALRVTVPAAGRLAAVGKVGRTVVAGGGASVRRAGAARLTLKLTRRGRRALRGKRSARVAVRVTFTPRGGGAAVRTNLTATVKAQERPRPR